MSVQIWTFVFIFLTFGLYIGIAVWSRAGSTSDFYVAGAAFHHWPTAWQLLQTGCPQPLLFLWPG